MHYRFLLSLLCLVGLFVTEMPAQCPPGDLNLSTQEQLDEFIENYPLCTHIQGDLRFGVDGVAGIEGLGSITSVSGNLFITFADDIVTLAGLSSLQSVGDGIWISGCPKLTNVNGLELITHANSIRITQGTGATGVPALSSLEGLSNLITVGSGGLWIEDQTSLESFAGLASLVSIEGDFHVRNNGTSGTLIGPPELATIGGGLEIFNDDVTYIVEGFEGLEEVGRLTISAFTNGFEIKPMLIKGTRNLRRINGDGFGGPHVYIEHVDTIHFDNLQFVEGDLPLQQPKHVPSLAQLQEVTGDINLSQIRMEEIPQFPILTHIGGDLDISFNDLSSQDVYRGFPALQEIRGQLNFGTNSGIIQLDAFNSLQRIGEDNVYSFVGLWIDNNPDLTAITGFQDLDIVYQHLWVEFNSKLNDCEAFCEFLENGTVTGDARFRNNGTGCTGANQTLECTVGLKLIDANPKYYAEWLGGNTDIRMIDPEIILAHGPRRNAIAVDGITRAVVFREFGTEGNVDFTVDGLPLEMPWGSETVEYDGVQYGMAWYAAPEGFPDADATPSIIDGIGSVDLEAQVTLTGDQVISETTALRLVRPPVVLVHGTYSTPDIAWKTASAGGQTMYDALQEEGFKVFAVDYTSTNGTGNPSSFEANKRILWENPGGLDDALTCYRDQLDIAVTQTDVVGHSLGGILPRVYASQHYNPDYLRDENFMEGDINRLVTLGATHFGSHLAEMQVHMEDASIFDLGPLEWIVAQAQSFITSWFAGTPATQAVRDQLPPPSDNQALALIGATEVPSHAITLSVPPGELKDALHDPNEEYFDLYWYISLLMYHNADLRASYLQKKIDQVQMGFAASTTLDGGDPQELFPGYDDLLLFKGMIEDGLYYSGQVLSVMDGTFELPSDIEILHYALSETGMGDVADPLLQIYKAGQDPVGVATGYVRDAVLPDAPGALNSYLSVYEENMEALRALIFNNDANDGVVRVESQEGNLKSLCAECVTHYDKVLHGFAPRYAQVQQGLVELLNGSDDRFHQAGFPAVGEAPLIYYPQTVLDLLKVPRTGSEAICQSGMVPAHARAFARVADRENVIIIVRPVNPDATPLIAKGAATKEMDVKPKSGNWGPQKGYLPVDQRYSKIWKIFQGAERTNKINAYNAKAQENLNQGITITRHLEIRTCNAAYDVYIDLDKYMGPADQDAADEVVLIPVHDPTKVCRWGEVFTADMVINDCREILPIDDFQPFEVMATPRVMEDDGVTPRFLTADYDLLMVGIFEGSDLGAPAPPEVPFRDGVGQITSAQESLVDKLNSEVAATGYEGGNVSHHGPENQFSASPYIDYPVTVFAPDDIPNGFFSGSSGGKILSIDMGPPGFRDIHLKRFVNKMRAEGYDLYENPEAPGWHWEWDAGIPGFQLEDSKDLVDYVEQLPTNACDKSGRQYGSVCATGTQPTTSDSWLFKGVSTSSQENVRLFPNPANTSHVQLLAEGLSGEVTYTVVDAFGNVVHAGRVVAQNGSLRELVDISSLQHGIYTVTLMPAGPSVRFVRM